MKNKSARKLLKFAVSQFTYPRDPKDFLQVFNNLTSARYTRGIVSHVTRETPDTSTIFFKAGDGWIPHVAGQWARIGVSLNGKRVWRPFSISAAEGHDPSITVKANGEVSTFLVHDAEPGTLLYLEEPSGQFVLEETPASILFIVAGSGITPVMSMLRTLMPRRPDHDVVLLYSSKSREDCIFHDEILELADQFPGLKPIFRFSREDGRIDFSDTGDIPRLCPDYQDREIYSSGPDSFVSQVQDMAILFGGESRVERFDLTRRTSASGNGEVYFSKSGETLEVTGADSILEAAENSGRQLPHGCRIGICRSCLAPMTDGQVSDIRTGEVTHDPGLVQTCITRPAPWVELDV
ncbi:hypothetical protein CKW39_14580 [Kocuria sp. WRN011]|uniref:flavin reductase family protein n=1 Tax=Kocuria sp. WRN011 TaxID=2029858 RepID=UPI000BAF8F39|nr:iron-sulfur cluster-binding domain-containing protein [Kocuria sp. WRN011]PBB07275.1 hypothetical protein CKW39_14580 [Kocuria sp. WRN011]